MAEGSRKAELPAGPGSQREDAKAPRWKRPLTWLGGILTVAVAAIATAFGTGIGQHLFSATIGAHPGTSARNSAQSTNRSLQNMPSPVAHPKPTSLTASINIKPGSIVPECTSISGSVTGRPRGKDLWLFTEIPNKHDRPSHIFYLLYRLRPNSQGAWLASISLGGREEQGRPYWLEVISSNPSVTGPVNVKEISQDALSAIPSGFNSNPLITVKVLRGRSNASAADKCIFYHRISMH
jgi:hypothetical protein